MITVQITPEDHILVNWRYFPTPKKNGNPNTKGLITTECNVFLRNRSGRRLLSSEQTRQSPADLRNKELARHISLDRALSVSGLRREVRKLIFNAYHGRFEDQAMVQAQRGGGPVFLSSRQVLDLLNQVRNGPMGDMLDGVLPARAPDGVRIELAAGSEGQFDKSYQMVGGKWVPVSSDGN